MLEAVFGEITLLRYKDRSGQEQLVMLKEGMK